jgi:hypothetical protein
MDANLCALAAIPIPISDGVPMQLIAASDLNNRDTYNAVAMYRQASRSTTLE